jgi:hypothetical protein
VWAALLITHVGGTDSVATPAQIAANQRNSLKSTGPKTRAGKEKAAMNARTHGMRAETDKRARETSLEFQERLMKWYSIHSPRNESEELQVRRNVALSFEIERASAARIERWQSALKDAVPNQRLEACELGKRLFYNPGGGTHLYGIDDVGGRTSGDGKPGDPDDPNFLVIKLESTSEGCHWLLEQWALLRDRLEPGCFWQAPDRLKAIRLVGRQPMDAAADPGIAQIFAACHAIHPDGRKPFDDLQSDTVTAGTHMEVVYRIKQRWPDLFKPGQAEEARQFLLELVDEEVARITASLAEHEADPEAASASLRDRLGFDLSPDGAAMRAYELRCTNALIRGMQTYQKMREKELNREEDKPVEPRRVPDFSRWSRSVGANTGGFTGGNEGRREGTEGRNGAVIGGDAPNEANLGEHVKSAQLQENLDVRADLGVGLGLGGLETKPISAGVGVDGIEMQTWDLTEGKEGNEVRREEVGLNSREEAEGLKAAERKVGATAPSGPVGSSFENVRGGVLLKLSAKTR